MKKLLYLIALTIVVATVSAKPRKGRYPTAADIRKAEYLYSNAVPVSMTDSTDVFFELLRQAYSIDSTDITLQGEYGIMLSLLGQGIRNDTLMSEGVRMARKAFMANQTDLEFGRRYIVFLKRVNEDSLARDAVRLMRLHDPLNEELLQLAIDVVKPTYYVSDTADLDLTLSLLDTLEMAHGVTPETTRERASLHLLADDTQMAMNTVRSFFKANKRDREANLLMMRLFSVLGENDSVIQFGTRIYNDTPTDLDNVVLLSDAYLEKGDTAKYLSILKETMLNDGLPPEVLPALVKTIAKEIMQNEGMEDDGYPMITDTYAALVKAHPYDEELMHDYIGWLYFTGTPASTQVMEDYVNLNPSSSTLWLTLIGSYLEQKQSDRAIEAATQAERYFPQMVQFPVVKVQALMLQTPMDTIAVARELGRADTLATDTTSIDVRSGIKSMRADISIALGDTAAGINFYRQALQLKPDNLMTANNLAYNLALQNTNLDEARTLIERCLRNYPDDYTWLDTYAWVLYRQGEYASAAVQIDKAIELMSTAQDDTISAEIAKETYEHAGDIHFKAGNLDEALRNWKRALVYAPRDAVLMRKIKNKNSEP